MKFHPFRREPRRLHAEDMQLIMMEFKHMSAQLDRLTADVAQLKSVDASATALLAGLASQIRDNANDPVALGALADDIEAQNSGLAAAVVANTPGAAPVTGSGGAAQSPSAATADTPPAA